MTDSPTASVVLFLPRSSALPSSRWRPECREVVLLARECASSVGVAAANFPLASATKKKKKWRLSRTTPHRAATASFESLTDKNGWRAPASVSWQAQAARDMDRAPLSCRLIIHRTPRATTDQSSPPPSCRFTSLLLPALLSLSSPRLTSARFFLERDCLSVSTRLPNPSRFGRTSDRLLACKPLRRRVSPRSILLCQKSQVRRFHASVQEASRRGQRKAAAGRRR